MEARIGTRKTQPINPTTNSRYSKTDDRRYRQCILRAQWFQGIVTAVAAVAGIIGLVILNGTLKATKEAAKAGTTQSQTAQKEFELSERPWVLARHEITTPLTFVPNGGAVLEMKETLENSGGSTAINIESWADLIPLGPDGSGNEALRRQTQYCDAHRVWEKERSQTNLTGYVLFPKHELCITEAMGLTGADLAKAVAMSRDSHKRVGFYVVGCVWYRTLFEPTGTPIHQTRFVYMLGKPLGPQQGTVAALKSGLPVGTQPMVEPKGTQKELALVPEEWGNYAD